MALLDCMSVENLAAHGGLYGFNGWGGFTFPGEFWSDPTIRAGRPFAASRSDGSGFGGTYHPTTDISFGTGRPYGTGSDLVPVGGTLIVGFAMVQLQGSWNLPFFTVGNSAGEPIFSLRFGDTGIEILDTDGATVLATAAVTSFVFLEVKCTVTGIAETTITMRADELEFYSGTITPTAVVTAAGSVAWRTGGVYGSNRYTRGFMDFYILDATGTTNNDFLGDCRVQPINPDGEGTHSDWALGGSDTDKVAAMSDSWLTAAADPGYIRAATLNAKQSFTLADPSITTGDVKGVSLHSQAQGEENSSQSVATLLRSGGTTVVDDRTVLAPVGGYAQVKAAYDVNPVTGAPFTMAEILALEAGVALVPS